MNTTNTVNVSETTKVTFEAAEKTLQAKYPKLKIVPGSMVQDVDHPIYKNKRRVKVICPGTGVEVERATSDLHTFIGSPEHVKAVRKERKAAAKAAAKAEQVEEPANS